MSFFGEGFCHDAIGGFWDTSMGSHVLLLVGYHTSGGGGGVGGGLLLSF